MDWKNKLYFGDNLGILREHVSTESVDLIYLDPPFKSSATHAFSVAALYERRPLPEQKATVADRRNPRRQILTIAELLQGKKILFPEHRVETFPKAGRKTRSEQPNLF